MNDLSYINLSSMSDEAISKNIGAFIKHQRMEQRKTQDEVSKEAGISRSTLSLLERGNTVTVATLIQILRVLEQLQVLRSFEVKKELSPLQLAKEQAKQRYRVRKKKGPTKKSEW